MVQCKIGCHIKLIEQNEEEKLVECRDCNKVYILKNTAFNYLNRNGYVV